MNWEAKLITHRNEKRIAVSFEKNYELIARIKTINGSRWSQTLRVWHVPDTEENRKRFKIPTIMDSMPSEESMENVTKFNQWLRSKRYSENTINPDY